MEINVTLNLTGLDKLTKLVTSNSPVVLKTLKQWAFLYRAWAQNRFDKYSKGGGDWPALSPITIRRRRGKGQNVAILRDTGLLFMVLQPVFQNIAGSIETFGNFSVTTGYGGSALHTGTGSRATIADIASFHNYGMGHNPKREIIAAPDDRLYEKLTDVANKNLGEEAHATNPG
jgi:hypothetical protein